MAKEQNDYEDKEITESGDTVFIKDEYNGWTWHDKNHAKRLLRGLYRLQETSLTKEPTTILKSNGLSNNLQSFDSEELDHYSSVLRLLQEMRERGRLTDVTLQVREGDKKETLSCHRAVLAACSTYFNAMLFGNFREGQAREITIEEISSSTLRHIVDYFYTGTVKFTARNVVLLFHASSMFQLPFLTDACSAYMVQNMNSSNCLGVFQLARTYCSEKLVTEAKCFALEHLPEIVHHGGEFEDLTVEELEELVLSDRSHMWGEETILEGIFRWVSWDVGKRRAEIYSMLQKIDLSLVYKDYLKYVMATQFPIKNSLRCIEVMEEAIEKIEASKAALTVHKLVLQIGGVSGSERADYSGERVSFIDCFDPVQNVWAAVTELPQRIVHAYLNTSVLKNDVYVLATFPNGQSSEVWKYSCMHDIWRRLPNLQELHSWNFVVQAEDKKVYALGGDGRTLKSSEKYYESFDPVANKWTRIKPVPQTIHKACAASCMNKLFVMGYWDTEKSHFLVHVYQQNGWRTFYHTAFHGCNLQYQTATLGGSIYLLSLLAPRQDSMCAYDTEKNVFEKIPLPANKRLQCGMTATDDAIVITGGRDLLSCTYATGNAEIFRPERGRWTIVGKQPGLLRRGHTCVTVPGTSWMMEKLQKVSKEFEENTTVDNEESDFGGNCRR